MTIEELDDQPAPLAVVSSGAMKDVVQVSLGRSRGKIGVKWAVAAVVGRWGL